MNIIDKVIWQYKNKGLEGIEDRLKYHVIHKIKPTRLNTVGIELCNICNLKCDFCFITNEARPRGYMDFEVFKKIINECSKIKVNNISLNYGGESLCHPQFKEFLKYAAENRKNINKISWVDNGMLFSHEISDLVIELEIDAISFSLEGFSEVNDVVRKGCNYEKVKNNILYLLEKRGTNKKPFVEVNTLNPSHDMKFIEYWVKTADSLVVSTERSKDNELVDKSFFGENPNIIDKCKFPFMYLGVLWNGDTVTCCSDGYGINNMGNVNKYSIKEIWNSQNIKNFRKTFNSTLCRKCNFWKLEFKSIREINYEYERLYQDYWIIYRKRH